MFIKFKRNSKRVILKEHFLSMLKQTHKNFNQRRPSSLSMKEFCEYYPFLHKIIRMVGFENWPLVQNHPNRLLYFWCIDVKNASTLPRKLLLCHIRGDQNNNLTYRMSRTMITKQKSFYKYFSFLLIFLSSSPPYYQKFLWFYERLSLKRMIALIL